MCYTTPMASSLRVAARVAFKTIVLVLFVITPFQAAVSADYLEYGDENLCNTGTYPSDPKAGATLVGLAPNTVTLATTAFPHSYPFSPDAGDYPGTDQIYVGSTQTASHDGYSEAAQRINGPQVLTMDYSSLIPEGQAISTLTLGIAADDFQFPVFGQPFTASINGITDSALTTALESLNESGPVTQFFTIGIDPSTLAGSNVLTLSINEGGDGADGWAIDFLTVGVTTQPVPEPGSLALLLAGVGAAGIWGLRRKRGSKPGRSF